MAIESHVFGGKDGKKRAEMFRYKKNKTARSFHWVMTKYYDGYKVIKLRA